MREGNKRAALFALAASTLVVVQAPCLHAAPPNPHRALSQHALDHWDGSSGLPDGLIFDLAQTPDGYLWLGTRYGLIRFDGWRFETFDSLRDAAFSSDGVTALAVGGDGRLWVGGMDGSLLASAGDGFERHVEPDPELADSVLSLFVDSQGEIWAWRDRGGPVRYSLSTDGLDARGPPPALADLELPLQRYSRDAIVEDEEGSLWLATAGSGALNLGEGEFRRIDRRSGLADDFLKAVVPDPAGGLWLLSNHGVHRIEAGKVEDRTRAMGLDPAASFSDLHLDRSGALWVAERRIHRFFDGRLDTLDAELGLDPRFLEDRDGHLWIATRSHGLYRLRRDGITPLGAAEGFDAGVALSTHRDRQGNLWIGTSRNGLYVLDAPYHDGTVIGRLTTANGLPHDRVWSIAEDRRSTGEPAGARFWLGTDGGLAVLRGRRVERVVGERDGLPQDRVRVVYQDPEDAATLWIGTVDGGLARWHSGDAAEEVTVWTSADGLMDDAVRFVRRDREGSLWIGQGNGLSRLREGRLETFTKADGLASTRLRGAFEDSRGRLWVGTAGGGVSRFDGEGFHSYGRAQGLEMRDVWGFHEDGGGRLWLAGDGLSIVALDAFDALDRGEMQDLGARTIESPLLARATCCVAGGAPVIVPFPGGVAAPAGNGVVLAEEEVLAATGLPAVHIESVLADGQPVEAVPGQKASKLAARPLPALDVPAGTRELRILYSCPSLPVAKRLRFRYRLGGDDWTDAGSRRTAFLSRVPPGHYQFEVQAAVDADWRKASAAMIPLRLQPHWWQSPWFRAALILLAAAIALTWHLLRTRRIARHTTELRREIDRRRGIEGELRRQVEHTQATLAELEERQNQLHHVSRVAVLSESSAAFAHELRQPLAALITNAQAAKRFLSGGNPDLDEIVQIVSDMIEDGHRAAGLLQSLHELLQFHEVRTKPIELDPLLRDTAALMHGEADFADLTLEVEVEAGLPPVEADKVHLQQVFVNLVRNAFEAMATTPPSDRRLGLRAARSERAGWVDTAVTDSGPGFPGEPEEFLLPFLTTKSEGLGMGLAICRSIVEAHGGAIEAKNSPGGGAEVVVSLPVAHRGVDLG